MEIGNTRAEMRQLREDVRAELGPLREDLRHVDDRIFQTLLGVLATLATAVGALTAAIVA